MENNYFYITLLSSALKQPNWNDEISFIQNQIIPNVQYDIKTLSQLYLQIMPDIEKIKFLEKFFPFTEELKNFTFKEHEYSLKTLINPSYSKTSQNISFNMNNLLYLFGASFFIEKNRFEDFENHDIKYSFIKNLCKSKLSFEEKTKIYNYLISSQQDRKLFEITQIQDIIQVDVFDRLNNIYSILTNLSLKKYQKNLITFLEKNNNNITSFLLKQTEATNKSEQFKQLLQSITHYINETSLIKFEDSHMETIQKIKDKTEQIFRNHLYEQEQINNANSLIAIIEKEFLKQKVNLANKTNKLKI